MFTYGPVASTTAVNVNSTDAPLTILMSVHAIVGLLLASNVPTVDVFVIALKPAGTMSVTSTPVASLGPSFSTVMVNVTVSPTSAVASSTSLTKLRSITAFGTTTASSPSSSSVKSCVPSASSEPIPPPGVLSAGLPGVLSTSS